MILEQAGQLDRFVRLNFLSKIMRYAVALKNDPQHKNSTNIVNKALRFTFAPFDSLRANGSNKLYVDRYIGDMPIA